MNDEYRPFSSFIPNQRHNPQLLQSAAKFYFHLLTKVWITSTQQKKFKKEKNEREYNREREG
jgi:hypothetical protein